MLSSKENFYTLKARFCLFLVVITTGLLAIVLCEKEIFLIKEQFFWSAFLLLLLWLLLLLLSFGLYRFFRFYLPKQKIHNQPSWVYYFYWVVVLLCLPMAFFCFLKARLIGVTTLTFRQIFILLGIYIISWLAGILIYRKTKARTFNQNFRFAPDSAGLGQDSFDFKIPAKNIAEGLCSLDEHVNVVVLQGDPGGGKSSYARMIIESLDQNRILYSYISLTETNEGKEFSKLFSERWHETLNTRYPKMHITEYVPLLRSIFRESGLGFFFEIMSFLSKFNYGIIHTKAKVYDKYIAEKNKFVTAEVASLFGNIPIFIEDFWIIVIDELERSPIIETYRVIEMIERFKLEGRKGLPIKIIFFICIGDDMKNLVEIDENKELRYLIDNFLVNSPKSITQRLFLPPFKRNMKYGFIADFILRFKKENSIVGAPDKREDFDWGYIDPFKAHLTDIESIKFTTNILVDESPRVIKRCLLEVSFFYRSFRDFAGVVRKDAIRFSDILLMSYIKLKYSDLITFFIKTAERLYRQSQNELDPEYLHERLLRDDKKEPNESVEVKLLKWISRELNIPYEKVAKLPIAKLVAAISHSYVDKVNDIDSPESSITYDGTLSDPARLMDYLVYLNESVENKRGKLIDLYQEHQNNILDLKRLTNQDLVEYSRILRDIKKARVNLNLEVAKELCTRIIENKIELIPNIVQRDTLRYDAVYEFSFQLLEILDHQRIDKKFKDESKLATSLFIEFLNSKNIDTGSKFIIINSFVNEERGGGADIHFRLQRAFEIMLKINKNGIVNTIQNTFKEVDERYLSGDEIIYEKEENFFYVLYQAWSGKSANKEELARIHAAAVRGIEDNLAVIKLYWSRFPASPNAQDYDDAVEHEHFFGDETKEFNITLKKLLEISHKQPEDAFNAEEKRRINLWQKILNTEEDAKKYYQRYAVKDKNDTLASFLIRKGYLADWPPSSFKEKE